MMMKRTVLALTFAVAVAALALPATAEEQVAPPRLKWSFAGPFGKYDPAQLQRGFKIYREVCSALPFDSDAGLPQSRRAGRARLLRSTGGGGGGRGQDPGSR